MKIVLQNTETKLFLIQGGTWTDRPEEALAFPDETRARDYFTYRRLSNLRVAVIAEPGESTAPPAKPTTARKAFVEKPLRQETAQPGIGQAETAGKQMKSAEESAPAQEVRDSAMERTEAAPALVESQSRQAPQQGEERVTQVEARIDVGFGNVLFIRGQGDGLSWEKGQPLQCVDGRIWTWSTTSAKDKVVFKLLLNDQTWAKGEDLVVKAGERLEVAPAF